MKSLLTLATVAMVLVPLAASASTLPRVDFHQGDRILSAGLLDIDFDYALTERLSIGASLIPSPELSQPQRIVLSPLFAAARLTYRAGEWGVFSYGVTLGGGVMMAIPQVDCGPDCTPGVRVPIPGVLAGQYAGFVQPALDCTLNLERVRFRATLGPVLSFFPPTRNVLPVWPGLEVALPFSERDELTVLGNGFIGWRHVF